MNKTAVVLPEILFSEDELEKLTGMTAYELRLHLPADCGSPGHWRLNAQSRPIYTEMGIERLAAGLKAMNYEAAAHTLLVELKQRRDTPSRALVPGVTKGEPAPWFREGGMA